MASACAWSRRRHEAYQGVSNGLLHGVLGGTIECEVVDHRANHDPTPHEFTDGIANVFVIPAEAVRENGKTPGVEKVQNAQFCGGHCPKVTSLLTRRIQWPIGKISENGKTPSEILERERWAMILWPPGRADGGKLCARSRKFPRPLNRG